jgi:hypothetical protein
MKKTLFFSIAMLVSSSVFAATDHYILRDGNLVQHLKITEINDEITVSADVDFDPSANEKDTKACSSNLSAEAKRTDKNTLVLKKHSEVDASFCELTLHLTDTGAKVEQSKDCDNFATGLCRFSTENKELVKIK